MSIVMPRRSVDFLLFNHVTLMVLSSFLVLFLQLVTEDVQCEEAENPVAFKYSPAAGSRQKWDLVRAVPAAGPRVGGGCGPMLQQKQVCGMPAEHRVCSTCT